MMQSMVRASAQRLTQRVASASTLTKRPSMAMQLLLSVRALSTGPSSAFAAVDHSDAYDAMMKGQHGQQLALAALEGEGRDDPPFDPFIEEEREEARLLWESENEGNIQEAEIVEDGEEEEDEYDEEADLKSLYNNDGSLRRKKSELSTLRAGAPAGGLIAIIELAGSQHKVTTDDVLIVNRLQPVDTFQVGSIHTLKDVMLVSSSHLTLVGMPHVAGAEVDVMVEEVTKDAKVIVFKRRRRKNYRKKNGHRRDVTMLRVLDIRTPDGYASHAHMERPEPDL